MKETFLSLKKGLSWPEFIVSASVIALGITLVASAILSAHIQSTNTHRRSMVKQISLALETHYFHHGHYPVANQTDCNGFEGFTIDNNDFMASLVQLGYLNNHPTDSQRINCSIKYVDLQEQSGYKLMWQELGANVPLEGCNEAPNWYCFIR